MGELAHIAYYLGSIGVCLALLALVLARALDGGRGR